MGESRIGWANLEATTVVLCRQNRFQLYFATLLRNMMIFCSVGSCVRECLSDWLTTERSEVVPFFRAVRAKKRGREATLPGGRSRPHLWSRSDLYGRGVTFSLQGVPLRSPVFFNKVVPNVDRFGRNLAGMIFWSSPTEWFCRFCNWPPKGWVIKWQRQKNGRFGHFHLILTLQRAHEGHRGPKRRLQAF